MPSLGPAHEKESCLTVLSQLDFVGLRLLVAVLETGSITAGASRSHLSVAAASKRISDLEERLGLSLFTRHRRGIRLTAAGEVFIQHARALTQAADSMEDALRDVARGVSGRVHLVANHAAVVGFLPKDLASFASLHPDIRVDLEEDLNAQIIERLQGGSIEVGLFDGIAPPPGMRAKEYRQDRLILIVPVNHPLAKLKTCWFAESLEYDYVSLPRGSATCTLLETAAVEAGIPLRLRMELKSFEAVYRMVAAGLGVGITPSRLAQDHVNLGLVKEIRLLDEWAVRSLFAGVPANGIVTPAAQQLLNHLCSE